MTVSIPPPASPAVGPSAAAAHAVPQATSQSGMPPQTDAMAKVDTVELSSRAVAAQAMLAGAEKASSGQGPELDLLTQQVANGTYLPASHEVAAAFVQFERGAGKGSI
jgi:hypothetical protein